MADTPTSDDVRDLLEGYCIDSNIVSDTWIENIRDNFVIKFLEGKYGFSLTTAGNLVEYYSGRGTNILTLNKRPVNSLVKIEYVVSGDSSQEIDLNAYQLIAEEGVIKAIKAVSYLSSSFAGFPKGNKNIKVTYNAGYDSDDLPVGLATGILYLTTEKTLDFLADRCGGGNTSSSGYSKDHGPRGKYTNIRDMLARMGWSLVNDYFTSVTGD